MNTTECDRCTATATVHFDRPATVPGLPGGKVQHLCCWHARGTAGHTRQCGVDHQFRTLGRAGAVA